VFGRDCVHRTLATLLRGYTRVGARLQRTRINGADGLLALDAKERLINVLTVSSADGSIQTIRSVVNPDKLRHLGYELSHLALIRHTDELPFWRD
jgi:RNA polymerase sigma-70 factor (ECF subfamily)